MRVGPDGPRGRHRASPARATASGKSRTVQGRPCLTPDERSYYLYFVLPAEFLRARAAGGPLARRRVLRRPLRPVPRAVRLDGPRGRARRPLQAGRAALGRRRRRACAASGARSSRCPTSTPARTQNQGASFRVEFRREVLVSRLAVSLAPPADAAAFTARGAPARAEEDAGALLPHQLPLHRDHQRLQLQVHVVPGRHHGPAPRLHEEGEGLPDPRRDRGQALLAGPALPGEAAPDGRAHAPPRPARHRRARGEPRASASSSTRTAASSPRRTSTPSTGRASPT